MKRKAITIGSDCSGVGTDAIALSRLGVRFENLFASDSDPHCRAVLECILDIIINIDLKRHIHSRQSQHTSQ